jgi:Photosynthetic reaction centre cytochrome C subunit
MRLTILFLTAVALFAQPPGGGGGKGGPPQPHKNLKILTDEEVRPAMGAFRAGLGVQCTYCHVQGDFASDANPKKDIARGMIVMNREINSKFLASKTQITCFTCHRAEAIPKTAPDAAAAPPAAPKAF